MPRVRSAIRCAVALLLASTVPHAAAQADLRVWHEHGQTWIRWTVDQTLVGSESWSVYRASAPIADITAATLIARTFPPDVQAGLLRSVVPNATWTAPDPDSAGTLAIGPNEALFVYTPRAALGEYFAVVKTGASALTSENTFGPVTQTLDDVVPHVQLTGNDGGHPYTVYAAWTDGDFDPASGRAQFPVMGNASLRGVPRVFCVFEPSGAMPPAPRPMVGFLHGGDGSYWTYRPSKSNDHQIDAHIEDGLYVTFDDRCWIRGGTPLPDAPFEYRSRWFGFCRGFDRFALPSAIPASDDVIADSTPRWIDWVLDWLISNRGVDPNRIALAGLSMGGRGTSIYVRSRPDRISAAMMYVPPILQADQPGWSAMFGGAGQNLPTTLSVDYQDLLRFSTPIAATDLPFARLISGTGDDSVGWVGIPGAYREVDDLCWGWNLYWDQREHTNSGNGWAGAHFNGSVRLDLPSLTGFQRDRSFPAIHHVDHALATSGLQPDPGTDVFPANGQPWGAWGGWFDWDAATLIDSADHWSATLRLRSADAFANDNSPSSVARAGVTVRRAAAFHIAVGDKFTWRLLDAVTGTVLRSGSIVVGPDGRATVPALGFSIAPRRLELDRVHLSDDLHSR